MVDVFLSYRRKDGETEAYLLYKDLIRSGYTVFFDHKNLGHGDFQEAIKSQICDSKCVLLILSESSFSDRINDINDTYRNEIKYALQYKTLYVEEYTRNRILSVTKKTRKYVDSYVTS